MRDVLRWNMRLALQCFRELRIREEMASYRFGYLVYAIAQSQSAKKLERPRVPRILRGRLIVG